MLAATHDERFVRDAADRRIELADGWIATDDQVGPIRGGGAPSAAGTPA